MIGTGGRDVSSDYIARYCWSSAMEFSNNQSSSAFKMHMVTQRAEALPVRPNENQGPTILGATMTVTIAALITMIARLFVRIHMIRNIGWDVSVSPVV
jgi:hypothetical protein